MVGLYVVDAAADQAVELVARQSCSLEQAFGDARDQASVAPHQHTGHGAQPRLEPAPRWRIEEFFDHELDVVAINVYRRSAHVSPVQQFKLGRRATPYFGDDPEAVPRSVAA